MLQTLVCTRVFDEIYETVTEADKKDLAKVEQKLADYCKKQTSGEVRFSCVFVIFFLSPLLNCVLSM